MNDLPSAAKFKVDLFADGTNLTMSGKKAKQLESNINNELIKIDNWMRENKFSINFSKTESMLISKKKKRKEKSLFNISINYSKITETDNISYFGDSLDNNLTWHYHIEKVGSKVVKGTWAIARSRSLEKTKVLLTVYYSLIVTHLNYCILAWGSASKTALLLLHIL